MRKVVSVPIKGKVPLKLTGPTFNIQTRVAKMDAKRAHDLNIDITGFFRTQLKRAIRKVEAERRTHGR